MKTIYEQFIQCTEAKKLSLFLCDDDILNEMIDEIFIVEKLERLFYKIYNVQTFLKPLSFERNISSLDQKTTLTYEFQYGSATISIEDNNMLVTFYHEDGWFKAPFDTDRCIVSVDHNLNFIHCEYSTYFAFLNSILHNNGSYGGYNHMQIKQITDINGSYNQLAFCHSSDHDDLLKDVSEGKLDKRFVARNIDLEKTFFQIIDFVTEKPHEFYAVFNEYPSFSECVDSSDRIIDFVNLFVEQYFNDNEGLQQHLLLLDMQAI